MAILIKGMKMPKPKFADITTVYNAYVLVHPNGHAVIVVENEDGLDSTEYPLTPVPPHGDLIDQGAAVQVAMEWCPDDDGTVGKIGDLRELLDEIEALPIIIESEEGT